MIHEPDTYRSTRRWHLRHAAASACARSTIDLLDDLTALHLDPDAAEYEFTEDERFAPFVRFVLTEIVLKGYATHGWGPLREPIPPA
jgi:hypothetical protein